MIDRAELVNAELAHRGAAPVALPSSTTRQKRTSTQATTRRKASE